MFALLLALATPAFAAGASSYRAVQSIALAHGSLEVLEDARLTRDLARRMWLGGVDPDLLLADGDPAKATFKSRPLRPARLRQLDPAGRVVADVIPEAGSPLARIETRRFGSAADPVYLVTTDDDAGFGSYSGRPTTLYRIAEGRLQPVRAVDERGRSHTIVLAATLKSAWKVVDAAPTHTVIRQLLCRPDFALEHPGRDQPFLLTLITYRSDGRTWRMDARVKPGFWEAEDPWPPISAFR